MLVRLLKYLFLPFLVFLIVFAISYHEFVFHTSSLQEMTSEMALSSKNFSFDRYYKIDHPMQYKVEITNRDQTQYATLLWPEEPYSNFLILVPKHDPTLDTQSVFTGRVSLCLYKCFPNDMLIMMDDFTALILNKFPQYKKEYSKLPQYVFNTAVQPQGIRFYLKEYGVHYTIVIVATLLALILFVKNEMKK